MIHFIYHFIVNNINDTDTNYSNNINPEESVTRITTPLGGQWSSQGCKRKTTQFVPVVKGHSNLSPRTLYGIMAMPNIPILLKYAILGTVTNLRYVLSV